MRDLHLPVLAMALLANACGSRPSPTSPGPEFAKDVSLGKYTAPVAPPPARGPAAGPRPLAAPAPSEPPAPMPPPETVRTSGFDNDVDGWTVVGDAQRQSVQPDYQGEGGNPGGLISARDDVAGGTFYFVAPAKYHGDMSTAYGKQLKFDLKTTSLKRPYEAYGVMLASPSLTLVTMLDALPQPVDTWHSYAIALDPSGGWKVVSGKGIKATADYSRKPDATEADLRAVLSALDTLRIRGEFNTGPDTGSLDNVHFGE